MKRNIFLYLFVFAALILIFQYMNSKKVFEANTAQIEKLENKVSVLNDSIQKLSDKIFDLQYFSLENNDDALSYYNHLPMDNLSAFISDKLIETNEAKGNNPLVRYEGMNGFMKINTIKILNHKWIIADFSDGKYWGELFLEYEIGRDLQVDFTLLEDLMYSN